MNAARSFARGELRRCGGPLRQRLGSAKVDLAEREGLWLELFDGDGHAGIGESAPLPGYSRESLAACQEALQRWLQVGDDRLPAAARCAVETALLDLRGQATDTPAPALLASGPLPTVALSALVSDLQEAEVALAAGVRTLKVKIGRGPFAAELQRLEAFRRAAGPSVALRLDANGSFGEAEVAERLRALEPLAPEFVEEPAAKWTEALRESPVVLALDETLARCPWGDPELERALGLARVAVLKPMLLGGPNSCLRLAERLVDRGLAIAVSHTWDGPVGLAAAATTALAIGARFPGRLRACGLTRHAGLAAWPDLGFPTLGAAALRPHTSPGLGLVR